MTLEVLKQNLEIDRFSAKIAETDVEVSVLNIETLQVNITKICNQACTHCHVESSPIREEQMDLKTVEQVLKVLKENPSIKTLDITGGAPELADHFEYMVTGAVALGKKVMVRHNLTVMLDKHPKNGKSMMQLGAFFKENKVQIVSSLPYYELQVTDRQRGKGVFEKSIEVLKILNNLGYGKEGSGLELNLVFNPAGTFLPPAQKGLKADFKQKLFSQHGIVFNDLFVITNMPIKRFKDRLVKRGKYNHYINYLINAFNPLVVSGIMCRTMISVGYDGKLYDCDFNQMLDMPLEDKNQKTLFDFDAGSLQTRKIVFDEHCFGCTAGSGSSCGGEIS